MKKSPKEKLVEYVSSLNQLGSITDKQTSKLLHLVDEVEKEAKISAYSDGCDDCKKEYNIP